MVLFLAVHEGASRGACSVAAKLLSKDEARRIAAKLARGCRSYCGSRNQTVFLRRANVIGVPTEEVLPRLLAVLKKLDKETEPSAEQVEVRR
jgi:hypothetical protein